MTLESELRKVCCIASSFSLTTHISMLENHVIKSEVLLPCNAMLEAIGPSDKRLDTH
jgi:hypothetical protein